MAERRRLTGGARFTLPVAWGPGESLIGLTRPHRLSLTPCSIAVRLARGFPFTRERLDAAADGVLVLVSLRMGRQVVGNGMGERPRLG